MLFGALSDRFHWTPDEIAELTYPQIIGYQRYIEQFPVPYTLPVALKE